jgi:hypothetical protein
MQYLVTIGDAERFNIMAYRLMELFAVEIGEHLFIKWELGDHVTQGASIDDIRIAWALYNASIVFDNSHYNYLATKIMNTVKDTMIVDNRLVDFYDWHYNVTNNQLFLSYYIVPAMEHFGFDDAVFKPLETLVANPFFKELYIDGEHRYAASHEVNMIDQALIAIAYFQRTGNIQPSFHEFVLQRLAEDGVIFARYSRCGNTVTSYYTSSSVYGLLLHYFQLTDEWQTAETVRTLLLNMPTYDATVAHFFDFMNKELALSNGMW